jgi:hypothetical protein
MIPQLSITIPMKNLPTTYLGALFDRHELTASFITFGGCLGERVLQLRPLFHRAP